MLCLCDRRNLAQQQLRAALRVKSQRDWSGHCVAGTRRFSDSGRWNLGFHKHARVAMAATWRVLLPLRVECCSSAERDEATTGSQHPEGAAAGGPAALGLASAQRGPMLLHTLRVCSCERQCCRHDRKAQKARKCNADHHPTAFSFGHGVDLAKRMYSDTTNPVSNAAPRSPGPIRSSYGPSRRIRGHPRAPVVQL